MPALALPPFPPRPRPRLVLTRARAFVIVTAAYMSAAVTAATLFEFVAHVRGESPAHAHAFAAVFAAAMVVCWLVSLVLVLREPGKGVGRG